MSAGGRTVSERQREVAERKRSPHPCSVCGTTIERAGRKTCSPVCYRADRKEISRRQSRERRERVSDSSDTTLGDEDLS